MHMRLPHYTPSGACPVPCPQAGLVLAALVAAAVPGTLAQTSANLVQNGSFESSQLQGWTLSGEPDGVFASIGTAHSGVFSAVFGATNTPAFLSQNLSVSAGQRYLLSFWVTIGDHQGGIPNQFLVKWGDVVLLDQSNKVFPAWTNLEFFVTATSSQSTLAFGGLDSPDYIALDDVSVTLSNPDSQPPEFLEVTKQSDLVNLTWRTVVGQVYQLQYKTDLSETVWRDIGSAITATNATTVVNDTPGTDARRFYRISKVP